MSIQTTPAKPEVKLPKAVMMQRDRANELLATKAEMDKKLKETPQQTNDSETQLQSQPENTPVISQPEVQSVVPAAAPTPVVEKEKTVEYWEHRFKTSQGMFEAEKMRLRTENQNLKDRMGVLEGQLKEGLERMRQAERQAPKTIDFKKYLSKEQIELMDPEVLNSIVKVASHTSDEITERAIKEELERHIAPMRAELDEARQSMQATKEVTFWETLDAKIPKWQLINDEPTFRDWLNQKDAFTGIRRQDLLTNAEKALDAERVVAMFETFIKSSSAPATSTPQPQVEARRVVPEPVGQTAVVTGNIPNNDVEWVTTSQVSDFYKDSALGKYRYRPQEKEAMEKKIIAARLANRVRKG